MAHRCMALTLYGTPRSRTMRVLWLLSELELEFEHVPVAHDDPSLKQPDFLALNPAGAVPLLVDDGFALAESLAITLYLVRTYGAPPLAPPDPRAEALAWRWTLFAQGHIEPWVERDYLAPGGERELHPRDARRLQSALAVLNEVLGTADWLSGADFGIADLNVAAVLSPSRSSSLDLRSLPRLEGWLTRCYGRPAARTTRERHAETS